MTKDILILLIIIIIIAFLATMLQNNTPDSPITNDTNSTSINYEIERASIPSAVTPGDNFSYTTIKEGVGDSKVKNGDLVTLHYIGVLEDGTVFDNSIDRGSPFSFTVGVGVIEGFNEMVRGMKKDGIRIARLPSDIAYGKAGAGALISPDATLYFYVKLIAIESN